MDYEFLLYYIYTPIKDPKTFTEWTKQLCNRLFIKGRIRISKEGANGIIGGSHAALVEFKSIYNACNEFKDVYTQYYHSGLVSTKTNEEQVFTTLNIKTTKEVISLDLSTNKANMNDIINSGSGTYLSPEQFHTILNNIQSDSTLHDEYTLVDIRNQYEVRIGHFNGAINPETRNFSEISTYFDEHIDEYKGKKVLMYCTGGVRYELHIYTITYTLHTFY